MSWEILFVFGLLILALVSFLAEKIAPDQTAFMVFAVLVVMGLLPVETSLPDLGELLTVFSNPAPVTIAAMLVLSSALVKCGAIKSLAGILERVASRLGYRRFLLALILGVAAVSAFINNTPVVMVFLPVVLSLSRTVGVPASKLLIPLSYASILGGTCTLVGTSTNILASSLLEKAGAPPIGMFELGRLGLPLLVVGTVYLVAAGDKMLPARETLTSILTDEERKEFLTEAFVQPNSPLVGQTVADSQLQKEHGVRVLEIIRREVAVRLQPKTRLEAGDRLVLACRPAGFAHARSIAGIDFGIGLETISAHEGAIVEGIVGPRSTIIGHTVREIKFRQRFRVILMAIHRRGVNLRATIDRVRLQAGDLLLMMGTDDAIRQLRKSGDVLLLDRPHTPSKSLRKKIPQVLGVVGAVILAVSFELVPMVGAALIGVALIYLTGVLKSKESYDSIEWSILFLIYGMLALGLALQTTGAADLLARGLTAAADVAFLPDPWKPHVVLALLYLTTMVLTETLSNNATVVLMTPLALSLAAELSVDARPFVIATCIAASASFSTPIGYQTNTYVYGVGGYRFRDFTRVGLPLNALYFLLSIILIPRIWAF
jgi:di/tricarboxylate transporter